MTERASAGEGKPRQRKSDGRWVVAVPLPASEPGERRRKVLYGWSRAAVVAKRDEFFGDRSHGLNPNAKLTVGRQLRDWLESVRPNVRPSTYVSYAGHVEMHLGELAPIILTRLTPNDVRRVIRGRLASGRSPRTVAYSLTVLRMALRQAVRDGLVGRNVAELVPAPRAPREEMRILSAAEARRLIGTGDPLWTLLVGTGLRLGEALGLRWSAVDLAAGTLSVNVGLVALPEDVRGSGPRLVLAEPKTSTSKRTIALARFVVEALEKRRAASEALPRNVLNLVFTSPRGTPLDARNVSRQWDATIEAVKLPDVRIHDLRHTAASLMLAQGMTLEDVKRVLGHSSIVQTSNTYGHLVEGRSREVADSMDRAIGGAG